MAPVCRRRSWSASWSRSTASEASRNRQSGGAGLGLTIASDIVRAAMAGNWCCAMHAGGGLVAAASLSAQLSPDVT